MANRVDMKKPLSTKEAIDFLNELDDETVASFYILPPEFESGVVSGEDDASEDEAGTFDDICADQLKSRCELVFIDGKRITTVDGQDDNDAEDDLAIKENFVNLSFTTDTSLVTSLQKVVPTPSSAVIPPSNKNTTFTWVDAPADNLIPIFPTSDFQDCKNLSAHQQFEKFFDDELLEHIASETRKYAIFCGKPNPEITVAELRTFIGILLVSGYNSRSSFRSFWDTDDDMRNEMVYNAMRRNRFQQILQFLHFEDSCKKVMVTKC